MFPILKNALCTLAIGVAVTHSHIIPSPTPNDGIPILVGLSTPAPTDLFRRGSCMDSCAQWLNGEGQAMKDQFSSHCSSFLSTAVGSTVVTSKLQITITAFANNGDYNYKSSTWSEVIKRGTNGLFTAFPTHLPKSPLSFPACVEPAWRSGTPFTEQWSSVCSCQEVMPITSTIATVTNTVMEQVPTTPANFKLRVHFRNNSSVYIKPDLLPPESWIKRETNDVVKALGFDATGTNASLFSLGPNMNLQSQSNGTLNTLGWIPFSMFNRQLPGKVRFIEANYANKFQAVLPRFHIQVASRADAWEYKLGFEGEEMRGNEFWVVTLPSRYLEVPDENFLLFESGKKVTELWKEFRRSYFDQVDIFAEPVV